MSETINPMEFMKSAATEKRAKENVVKTKNITKMMVDNSGIFGGQIDDDKSQIVLQEVTETLGSKYALDKNNSLVGGIEEKIRSGTEIQITIAQENLNVLSNSVFTAINFSFKGFNEELFTSVLSAEQMDSFLPVELKGLGKYIKEADSKLSETDKKQLIAVNKEIETNDLFNASNSEKSDAAKSWGEMARIRPQNSLSRQYLETCRSYLLDSDIDRKQKMDGFHNKEKVYQTYSPGVEAEDGSRGRGEHGFSYGPEKDDFAVKVMRSQGTNFRREMPASWFKKENSTEKNWYEMAAYMAEYAGTKTVLKDSTKGLEKLWFDDNIRMKLNEADFVVMYKKEGFKTATQRILKDFCVLKSDVNGGTKFLYLNTELSNIKDGKGNLIPKSTLYANDIDTYKENLAMELCKKKVFNNVSDYDVQYRKQIDLLKSSRGLDEDEAIEKWREVHNYDDIQIEVGTAWNFLYSCDFIESADFYRDLKPLDGVRGDTVNFIFHPEAKVDSKIRIDKGDVVSGKEEIKGGPLVDWYVYQLQHDPKFREEYRNGEHRLFPKRLGITFLDMYEVTDLNGEKMSLSRMLIEGKDLDVDKMPYKGSTKWNMYQNQKDQLEGSLTTFKYLTGDARLDGKNTEQWAVGINNGVALLRQQEELPGTKEKITIMDDVRFYAAIIYSSFGLNSTDRLMTVKTPWPSYKESLRQITMKSFIKSSDPELNKPVSLFDKDGPTKFQKQVFDFMYKNAVVRGVSNIL